MLFLFIYFKLISDLTLNLEIGESESW